MRRDARASRRAVAAAVIVLALAAPAVIHAQWRLFDSDFDDEKKPWSEIEARLPAYPNEGKLIPFEASGATSHRFFIDAASVSVGEDGVVRYTLVVKAAGGATNVFYEGMRCETRERKLYAVGRDASRWMRARNPHWQSIRRKDINAYHVALYDDFLCPERTRMTTAERIVETLRREGARLR